MFGILRSSTNTGVGSELIAIFAAPLEIINNQGASVSDTLSLKRVTQDRKAQRWEISSMIMPIRTNSELFVHSVLKNVTEYFYVRMPQLYSRDLMPEGYTPVVSLSASVGTDLIVVGGITKSLIKAGEFITFAGDSKVYLIVDNSDVTYTKVFPELRSTKAPGTVITYGSKVTMRAFYDVDNASGMKYIDGVLQDPGMLKLIEAT